MNDTNAATASTPETPTAEQPATAAPSIVQDAAAAIEGAGKFADAFRSTYRDLSALEKMAIQDAKALSQAVHDHISSFPASPENTTALGKLKEVVMWFVHGITG